MSKRLIAVALMALALAACGLKGDLVQADAAATPTPTPTPTPAPVAPAH